MSIFSTVSNLVGDIGFGVIRHSAGVAIGGGKAILGVVTGDDELIDDGLRTVGKGAIGLGGAIVTKAIGNQGSEEDETIDSSNG
ncbi:MULTISPECIES: hypothetical protein [Leptolyngbya]|uniref:hypothetical protein n=1 Tax=Leptolyngbya TaxID=47251 RepID=UPI0016879C13|nr:hypothetical protein [Leptolyngbya sp. FACHB-1624]MBD1855495.1 hypothetical protein [Leptolyngbya sp. FACHB-1624]